MKNQSNEQLCALAQKEDMNARDLLLKNNLGFIRKTANEIYSGMNLGESELSIDKDDLEQEGCIGLLNAIPHYDGGKGIKFLTYAATSIRNAMTDLIRDAFSQYEMRMTDTTDGLAFQKIYLDEVLPGEERMLRSSAAASVWCGWRTAISSAPRRITRTSSAKRLRSESPRSSLSLRWRC